MGIDQVRVATVWVSDLDAALDFYVGTLGLEKRADKRFGESGRWLTVAPAGSDGIEISLQPAGSHGEAGRFTGLVLGSSDVEGTAEELKRAGVTLTSEVERNTVGAVMCEFEDPDGNGFVLHSIPGEG